MRSRLLFVIPALTVLAMILAGCGRPGSSQGKVLSVKGSNTMLILGQAWAEEFNKKSDLKVSVSGEGSGVGIAALIAGNADIAESSREMEPEELSRAKAKGITPVETIVARDGLAIIVNPANPVRKLTMDQLRDIFMGTVTNWKELGGKDQRIVVVSRDTNSGTHLYFKEQVLRRGNSKGKEEFAKSAIMVVASTAAVQTVADDQGAIAYVGLGYVSPKTPDVAIAKAAGQPYVLPTVETVENNTYPVSRPLFFYTNGNPKGDVKKYMDFVLGPEGQKIVEQQDFVPVKKG